MSESNNFLHYNSVPLKKSLECQQWRQNNRPWGEKETEGKKLFKYIFSCKNKLNTSSDNLLEFINKKCSNNLSILHIVKIESHNITKVRFHHEETQLLVAKNSQRSVIS